MNLPEQRVFNSLTEYIGRMKVEEVQWFCGLLLAVQYALTFSHTNQRLAPSDACVETAYAKQFSNFNADVIQLSQSLKAEWLWWQ